MFFKRLPVASFGSQLINKAPKAESQTPPFAIPHRGRIPQHGRLLPSMLPGFASDIPLKLAFETQFSYYGNLMYKLYICLVDVIDTLSFWGANGCSIVVIKGVTAPTRWFA